MRKVKNTIVMIICIVLCVVLLIVFAVFFTDNNKNFSDGIDLQVLTVWQIDSFEGGRGSRAEYIRKKGEEYSQGRNIYIDVVTLTADAARTNLYNGVKPDVISYGSGIYGLECYINNGYDTKAWCRGGYCILSVESADFTLVSSENTIINSGKDNFTSIAALLCGLNGADTALPASAYVKLINGEYKFLLGTQRDIVRLQTRGVNFYVQPVLIFNDLYQNMSVVTQTGVKGDICNEFVNFLISSSGGISSLSLFCDGVDLYSDELSIMEGLAFEYTLPEVLSKDFYNQISKIVAQGDADKLKSLLKSL